MLEYLIVALVAFGASMLTFFSGFGLGTLLFPVLSLFFPLEIAVACTAIVHFLNNLFKLTLIGKNIHWPVVLKFGLPAIVGAFGGAWLLASLASNTTPIEFELFGLHETSVLNIVLGFLIFFFALFELIPFLKKLEFGDRVLIPGGILSGFFGGLSGHQGALRSAFLLKFPLTKEQFIASGVTIACLVDTIRIGTYAVNFDAAQMNNWTVILIATLAAFGGAFLGKKALKKITISSIQYVVGTLMIALAILMVLGYV